MNSKSVIFYAPFGRNTTISKDGGAESGCCRTLELLRERLGYDVITVEKAVNSGNIFSYLCACVGKFREVRRILSSHPDAIFHLSGMYGLLLPFELLLVRLASGSGHKVIYEIRNGDFVTKYEQGGRLYRSWVDKLASLADLFLCQGTPFVSFLEGRYGVRTAYYPNFVMDKYMPQTYPERAMKELRIIFFGRIVPVKNVEFVISVVAALKAAGMQCRLDLIGSYEEDYHSFLLALAARRGVADCVSFHGRMPFSRIVDFLSAAHFFLFPSKEPREGHSNSLTEAMAYGVVPVSSPAGFSRLVIGDDICVVDEFSEEVYASRILDIWKDGWRQLSGRVYDRVLNNYAESIALNTLKEVYESL